MLQCTVFVLFTSVWCIYWERVREKMDKNTNLWTENMWETHERRLQGRTYSLSVRVLWFLPSTAGCKGINITRSYFFVQTLLKHNCFFFKPAPTNWFVCHSHISGGPAAEATGQIIGFFHGCFSGVIGQRSWNVCGPSGQCVHATWAVETVGTPRCGN